MPRGPARANGIAMAKAPKQTESEAAEAEGEEGAKKGLFSKLLSRKVMIIAAAALLVLGGGGGGAYFFLSHKPAAEEKPVAAAKAPPAFFDLPEVMVNLQTPGNGRAAYLKARIVLEMEDQKLVEQVRPLMPRVMDAFQTYLREMRPSDLEGSAGLYRLRDELTRRVNLAVAPSKVNAVLFKEIIVQ
jgi:flagellar FliL protein